jgi:BMFP domain-containing protein YqiC
MKITEINEMRVKQQKLLEEKNTAHQSFHAAHARIMDDLDEQERIAHDDLIKRIKKHFKGITPSIDVTNRHVLISFNDVEFLDYRYGHTKFEGISKKLCNKIIAEYEEVYGEIEKKIPYMGTGRVKFPDLSHILAMPDTRFVK